MISTLREPCKSGRWQLQLPPHSDNSYLTTSDRMRSRCRLSERSAPLAKSVAVLVGGAGSAQLVTFAASAILTRQYDPSEFGAWASYSAILLTLSVISTLRFDLAIVVATTRPEGLALRRLASQSNALVSVGITIAMAFIGDRVALLLSAPSLSPWL